MNNNIDTLISASRSCLGYLNNLPNKKINFIIKLLEQKILDKELNYQLSEMAVKETGFGNINDKIYKNKYKTKNLIKEIYKIKTNVPILNKRKKIYEIIKPIGLISGVTPSTNPIATALNYIINSIKCRNSIIICPNPRSYNTSFFLIKKIKEFFLQSKIPQDIVNIVPESIIRDEQLIYFFNNCDKNIVTGNKNFISKVRKSIKPFLTFGVGNVPVIINRDADLIYATKSIVKSKSFDNSTSCSADSVLIIHKNIFQSFKKKLIEQGVYFLSDKEKNELDKIYFIKNMINPKLIGKSGSKILGLLNIKKKCKLIAYEKELFQKAHYIFNEKILPLIGIITFKKLDEAIKISQDILSINGLGHSAGIYTKNEKDIIKVGSSLNVSRIIVNQPHSQSAGGSAYNSLNTTLSLGCGTWGNSIINNNLNYLDFSNKTIISLKLKKDGN